MAAGVFQLFIISTFNQQIGILCCVRCAVNRENKEYDAAEKQTGKQITFHCFYRSENILCIILHNGKTFDGIYGAEFLNKRIGILYGKFNCKVYGFIGIITAFDFE